MSWCYKFADDNVVNLLTFILPDYIFPTVTESSAWSSESILIVRIPCYFSGNSCVSSLVLSEFCNMSACFVMTMCWCMYCRRYWWIRLWYQAFTGYQVLISSTRPSHGRSVPTIRASYHTSRIMTQTEGLLMGCWTNTIEQWRKEHLCNWERPSLRDWTVISQGRVTGRHMVYRERMIRQIWRNRRENNTRGVYIRLVTI